MHKIFSPAREISFYVFVELVMNLRLWVIIMRVNGGAELSWEKTDKAAFVPMRSEARKWSAWNNEPSLSSLCEHKQFNDLEIERVAVIMSAKRFMDLARRIRNNAKLIRNQ